MRLDELPQELAVRCLCHLSIREVARLRRVSLAVRGCADDRWLWLQLAQRHFQGFPHSVQDPQVACRELLGPASLRNRCVNDAYDEQCHWQRTGGENLVEAASLVAQDPCTFPAAQSQPLGGFHLLWEISSRYSVGGDTHWLPPSSLSGAGPARGFAYPCAEGMLDEEPTGGTHTLPIDKRADLTRAPIVVPSSPPAFGPGKPEGVSQAKWDRISGGRAAGYQAWKAWVKANFEDCFRCSIGLLNTLTGHANNLGFSKLYHNNSFGAGGCSFDPDWAFNFVTDIVLPTALLPAEIITEIGETISRGYNDAGRYDDDDEDGHTEHVRTLGLGIQLNLMIQRYQCEFIVAPRESDASIRTRLEQEPSAWFVSTFTVEVKPVLTYPSWHSWNPTAAMPNPTTAEPWYPLGSPFFTYNAGSGTTFRETRGHHKTDAMASCMVNAAFPGGVDLVLRTKSNINGDVHVHVVVNTR